MSEIMSQDARFGLDKQVRLLGPLPLDSGAALTPVEIAYETYGRLNADASNAVLVCHAVSSDQYIVFIELLTGYIGCSTLTLGPVMPLDAVLHFVIYANVIGS